jgi:hypothetical protein
LNAALHNSQEAKPMIGPAEIADMLSDYAEAREAAGLPSAEAACWPICELETPAIGARAIPFATALERVRTALQPPAVTAAPGVVNRA